MRLAYLERMGITVWCARHNSTVGFENPVSDIKSDKVMAPQRIADNSLRPVLEQSEVNRIEQASSPVTIISPLGSVDSAVSAVVERSPQEESPGVPVRFCFMTIKLSNGYLLLAELGDPAAGDLSIPESRLLSAIILALGLQIEQVNANARQLVNWPQSAGLTPAAGMKEAQEFVAAYLESQLRRTNASGLLLLGDTLDTLCLGDVQASSIESKHIAVINGHSLSSLLVEPHKKATLWHTIKHLRT